MTDDIPRAQLEACTALRLLEGAGSDAPLPELQAYAGAVALAVFAARGPLTRDSARQLADSLLAAREGLLADAGSFAFWMKLVVLVNPSAEGHRVPLRFVRWEEPVVGEPLVIGDPHRDTRQAVARFLGAELDP